MKKNTMITLAALTLGFAMTNVAAVSAMAAESKVPCAAVGQDGNGDSKKTDTSVAGAQDGKVTPAAKSAKDGK